MDFLELFRDKKVYHFSDIDLDGISAHIIARYFIEPICKKYIFTISGERDMRDFNWSNAEQSEVIMFSDIAPCDKEMYNKLIEMNKIVILVDHHITSRNELGDLPNYFYTEEVCGAKLLYNLITEGKRKHRLINDYVTLVDCYDCWRQENKLWNHAKDLHNLLMGMRNYWDKNNNTQSNRFTNKQLTKFEKRANQNFFFDIFEQRIIKAANLKEEKNYKEAKKNLQKRVDTLGNKYIFTHCISKISFVADRLLKEYKDYDYLAIRATWVSDQYKLSLRSKNGFKVNYIAEQFGGGGHESSSGCELTKEQYNDFKLGKMHLL